MSYATNEASVYQGRPVEAYRFAMGGQIWRWTSADSPQTIAGEIYLPEVISRSEVDQSNEDSAGSSTIVVARDNPVAALFVAYLPATPVALTVFRMHRGDGEFKTVFVGKIAAAAFDGSEATLQAMPITEVFRRTIPIVVYQGPCNHALYGPGCGVNREDFRIDAPLSGVAPDGSYLEALALVGFGPGRYRGGFVERSDGDVRFISESEPVGLAGRVYLVAPFQGATPGETYSFFPGCARTEQVCEDDFNNLPNHLGFARIPTKNPFNTDLSGTGGTGASGGGGGGGLSLGAIVGGLT